MFLPTSPRPPSGMIRMPVTAASLAGVVSGALGRDERAEALETVADARQLVLGRLDERQPEAAHVMAEEVEGGLDRDRVRLHLEQLVRGTQGLVQAPRLDVVALLVEPDHLLHLRPDHVLMDTDAADP